MKKNSIALSRSFKLFYFLDKPLTNNYNFPCVNYVGPQNVNSIKPFNFLRSNKGNDYWIHFFIDDYQFERVWNSPSKYINLFKNLNGVITTDFSMYLDMPKALQIYNCYRNRAVASYLQEEGINIIPTVSWGNEASFEWCFDGIAYGSAVAVSSNGCMQNKISKDAFLKGFNKMLEVINPCQIIFVGKVPEELKDNTKIVNFVSYSETFAKFKRKEV